VHGHYPSFANCQLTLYLWLFFKSAGILAIDKRTNSVLLLASRKREGAWVLPKGLCMTEPQPEAPESAACRIAWEASGIRGTISKKVGTFTEAGKRGKINAYNWMYEMQVDKLEDNWPNNDRQRIWVYMNPLRGQM
jgi:8-oxo-dGTP pyrophosphatase MutT (NUDIX family)